MNKERDEFEKICVSHAVSVERDYTWIKFIDDVMEWHKRFGGKESLPVWCEHIYINETIDGVQAYFHKDIYMRVQSSWNNCPFCGAKRPIFTRGQR